MDFEKKYNTWKEVDKMIKSAKEGDIKMFKTHGMGMDDLRKIHYFLKEHPGHCYYDLKRRQHIVIPKVLMKEGMLCNISELALSDSSPSDNTVLKEKTMQSKH